MKKLIYLFVACSLTMAASAQKVTQENLQGTWKLAAFNTSGIYLDLATGLVTISDELKSQLTPEMMTELNNSMKEGVEALRPSKVVFTGNNVDQNIAGQEKKGTFEIKDVNGEQHLISTYSDGTPSDTTIFIKDKQLHISKSEQGQSAELIFNKG
jgi:hypothetical protein